MFLVLFCLSCHPERSEGSFNCFYFKKIRHLDRNGEIFELSNPVVIPAQAGTLKRSLCCCPLLGLASVGHRRAFTFSLMKK